jgi:hypothetical protein
VATETLQSDSYTSSYDAKDNKYNNYKVTTTTTTTTTTTKKQLDHEAAKTWQPAAYIG